MVLEIIASPLGKLHLEFDQQDNVPSKLTEAFARGNGHGILALDLLIEVESGESVTYWRDFLHRYLALWLAMPNLESINLKADPVIAPISHEELKHFMLTVPPMKGAEYITEDFLAKLWNEIGSALIIEIQDSGASIEKFFSTRAFKHNLLGRVCFHLAENRKSDDTPFAFLATYVHRVDAKARVNKHLPLKKALEEYSSTKSKNDLIRLLAPIHRASTESAFLKTYVDSGDIYHALAWTPAETYQFLKDIPIFEKAGLAIKVPNWWKSKSRVPRIEVSIGEKPASQLGLGALIDFNASLFLDDMKLTPSDIKELMERSENLTFFKGQWVEIDKNKLQDLLNQWNGINQMQSNGEQLTLAEGMRLYAGLRDKNSKITENSSVRVTCGQWLEYVLNNIKNPQADSHIQSVLNSLLQATLRPYQNTGVTWLNTLSQLRLGAVLADDMGLGKTIQIISLFLLRKEKKPFLLIVPASLLGNWQLELNRFAPSLKYLIVHPSMGSTSNAPGFDLVITTYNLVMRTQWLMEINWGIIVLDEAQAIKNPGAKQTKAVKKLQAEHKLALTGTPIENRLSDLWSIFDFISPGLLGNETEFDKFTKRKDKQACYAALRSLVGPYILRRMKTDKSVISDLPDKTEMKTYCQLSKAQIMLYQKSVDNLKRDIATADGIARRGIILAYLMRFKQICNHPAHWLKDGLFSESESGKFLRLRELCEVIRDKQEKVLVFTQFKEMTDPLADFLSTIFDRKGLVLHGSTQIKQRAEMVEDFQNDNGPPFFVLSLKAGGSGLNLTAASHVIHFDRWWNPAVENQATDRAFRIGQKRNVLVHKFICQGTVEDRIGNLIESKVKLSKEILEVEAGALLTELSNQDLLSLVSLDINSAQMQTQKADV